jgi:hypothetical protein
MTTSINALRIRMALLFYSEVFMLFFLYVGLIPSYTEENLNTTPLLQGHGTSLAASFSCTSLCVLVENAIFSI